MYCDMVRAVMSFAQNDRATCAVHMTRITDQLRPLLSSYYDRLHDGTIARSVWLSHVQGFFAWGAGYTDSTTGQWVNFDGLSGNQVLLFHTLDAFLGLPLYLDQIDRERNVPARQRLFSETLQKHSFRRQLEELPQGANERAIMEEFDEILKRLRVSLHVGVMRALLTPIDLPFRASFTGQNVSHPASSRVIAYDSRQVAIQFGH